MREAIIEKVKAAGVVGAGGAGFPAHVKIDASVDTVLANGASCEPLLASDPWLLEQEIDTVLAGLQAAIDCTSAQRGIICLKSKHSRALAAVRQAVQQQGRGRVEVFELKDFYPAGDEHVLVREVLGRAISEAGIPLQVGTVVSNIESLFNIARALDDSPVTERYLTVAGEVAEPMVLKVPLGSLASEVIQHAGGPLLDDYRVLDGGPMMGRVLPDTQQPVSKTTSGLIVLPGGHNVVAGKIMDPQAISRITGAVCCQCTQCTELCPRHLLGHKLHPHKLMRTLSWPEVDPAVRREALLCSECGVCEKFACPMSISPRQAIMQIKKDLLADGIRWETNGEPPESHPMRGIRCIPSARLMQRLDVMRYDKHPDFCSRIFEPSKVVIPLRQHIGVSAEVLPAVGDRVCKGELVGEIPNEALGAKVHASIDGVVTSVAHGMVEIEAR